MLQVVYKTTIDFDTKILTLPLHSKILKVAIQHEKITIWYQCTPDFTQTTNYRVAIVGTGHKSKKIDSMDHLETIFNGPFVWHVYIKKA